MYTYIGTAFMHNKPALKQPQEVEGLFVLRHAHLKKKKHSAGLLSTGVCGLKLQAAGGGGALCPASRAPKKKKHVPSHSAGLLSTGVRGLKLQVCTSGLMH